MPAAPAFVGESLLLPWPSIGSCSTALALVTALLLLLGGEQEALLLLRPTGMGVLLLRSFCPDIMDQEEMDVRSGSMSRVDTGEDTGNIRVKIFLYGK